MSRIERSTGIKAETLKRYLELLRELYRGGLGDHLDGLLRRKAGLSSSDLADFHSFRAEFGWTRNPYRTRGQDPSIK